MDLWRRTWLFRRVSIIISLPDNLWICIHSETRQIISTREFICIIGNFEKCIREFESDRSYLKFIE